MFTQKRKHDRRDVQWNAKISIGGLIMTGQILDQSVGGAFFTPDVSWAEGFIQGPEILNEVEDSSTATLEICSREGRPVIQLDTRICWTGWSYKHQCYGMGVESLAQEVT